MIQINLLPEKLRKKERKKLDLPQLSFLPTVTAVVAGLVILHALLGALIIFKRQSAKRIDASLAKIAPQKQEYDAIKASIDEATLKQDAIDKLMAKRLLWSKKLNEISDSIVPGIWLSKLSIEGSSGQKKQKKAKAPASDTIGQPTADAGGKDKKKALPAREEKPVTYLVLEGYASGLAGEEMATVGKFINSLKGNKGFFEDFTEIKIDTMQRQPIKDAEAMNFKIFCFFKQK